MAILAPSRDHYSQEASMQHVLSNLLVGYWAGLHSGPKSTRPDLDDAILRSVAPNVFLLTVGRNATTFTASGTAVRRMLSTADPGANFLDSWGYADKWIIAKMIANLRKKGVPLSLKAELPSLEGPSLFTETVLMPVAGIENGPETLLGIFVSFGEAIAVRPNGRLKLITARFIECEEAPGASIHRLPSKYAS